MILDRKMKENFMIRFTQFALLICLLSAAPSKAALVLSLDAREPGPDPTNSWQDLSGTNSPFTANSNFDGTGGLGDVNAGSAPMLVNDPNSVGAFYDFNNAADTTGPAFFASSVGDNDNFDFDTAKGTSTDPFTVVVYGKAQGGSTDGVINKGRNSTNGVWFIDIQNNNNAELVQQPNNGGARNFGRWNGLTSSDEDFHLYVFHADGSGDASNSRLYYDGATADSNAAHPINGLGESILNDTELHIGAMENFGNVNDFDGAIQFIEIYTGSTVDNQFVSGMSPSDYSAWRSANLSAIIPEPTSLVLLGIGLIGLLGSTRRR